MAVILKFPEVLREPAKGRPDFDRNNAQILFFTGVRYERMEKVKRSTAKVEPEVAVAL